MSPIRLLSPILICIIAISTSVFAADEKVWRIMPVGDSITEGGKTFSNYRYPLFTKLKDAGYRVEYVGSRKSESPAGPLPHEGYGGKNAEFLATAAVKSFASQPADIVLIHAGHNHFADEKPIPKIVEATETMIKSFRETNPKVIVLLAKVITSGKLPKYEYIPALNDELGKLADRLNKPQQPVVIVNQADGFDPEKDAIADKVHPNAQGAEKMATKWFDSLKPVLGPKAAAAKDSRPNILIILADDVGFSDIGCFGGEIRTPHLDALASRGLRFTQFYNSTRCCPSRASLLTGLYPHQAGVGLMTSDQGAKFPGAGDQGNAFPGYRGSLNDKCVTIAEVLKPAGYRTAAVGKWHVGDRELPTKRGFDDFYGFVSGYAVDSWEPRMMIRLPEGKPQRSYKPGEFFATDAMTDHALDFLADMQKSGGPWLLYVGYQAGHFPVQSKREDMTGYAEVYAKGWDKIREERLARQKQLGLLPADTVLTPRSKIPLPGVATRIGSNTEDGKNPAWDSLPADRRADLAQRMAVYAGMVSGMDRNIGRMVSELRSSGQLDNTLILFLSDNGACAEWEPFGFEMVAPSNIRAGSGINQGTQGLPNKLYRGDELATMGSAGSFPGYGSGWANVGNTPWRLYKHYGHEGGISGPFIAHWPARIESAGSDAQKPGRVVSTPSHLIDIMATCVDIGGATYPKEAKGKAILPAEGISLNSQFGKPSDSAPGNPRLLFWEHEGNAAMRDGDWKLVRIGRKGAWELYDVKTDRSELHDLAVKESARVTDMAAKWEAWAERTHVTPYPK